MGNGKKNMAKNKLNIAAAFIINPYVRRQILQTAEEMEKALKAKKPNPKNREPL